MDKYYYLVSQLPYLSFGKPPQITSGYFLAQAENWLSQKEYLFLPALREYELFDFNLRRELSLYRAGKEFVPSLFSLSLLKESSPLEAERELLRLRWNFLEREEMGHYFDLKFLSIYLLKLKILERLFTFDKEKGEKKFDEVCALTYEQENRQS